MNDHDDTPTHTAFAERRLSRRKACWLQVGQAVYDPDSDTMDLMLDRLPIGGFNGRILLHPYGIKPPPPEPENTEEDDTPAPRGVSDSVP